MTLTRIYQCFLVCALIGSANQPLAAQRFLQEPFVGNELETYLRNLQVIGKVPLYPWTIRSFSPAEVDGLLGRRRPSGLQIQVISPSITTYYNSAFPYGFNDGPIWQGRGLTTAIQFGLSARWRIFSLQLAPMYSRAENRAFKLIPNGQTGTLAYGHPVFAPGIDLPQRFGSEAYEILDPGQSTFRLDIGGITTGVSTANQWWGPATEYPYLLGNNAAGFPHVFLGTSHPLNVKISKIHTRLIWGSLAQSKYSPVTGSKYYVNDAQPGRRRFATGMIFSLIPAFSKNLELGLGRFYHIGWPASGLGKRTFLRPLDGFVKGGMQSGLAANQLASFWFRWVLPNSGFEFYGEYGREDYNLDLRDLYLEPDHDRAYNLGFRKVSGNAGRNMKVFRAEWFNGQDNTLAIHRNQNSRYTHAPLLQGHTYRGQLLGSPVGVGSGAGTTVAFDKYAKGGRWSFTIRRLVTIQYGTFYINGVQSLDQDEILPSAEVENVRSVGPLEIITSLGAVVPTKNFYRSGSPNTRVTLGIRYIR